MTIKIEMDGITVTVNSLDEARDLIRSQPRKRRRIQFISSDKALLHKDELIRLLEHLQQHPNGIYGGELIKFMGVDLPGFRIICLSLNTLIRGLSLDADKVFTKTAAAKRKTIWKPGSEISEAISRIKSV